MRRVGVVPVLAAAVVVGHLAYHRYAPRVATVPAPAAPAPVAPALAAAVPSPRPEPPHCADREGLTDPEWQQMRGSLERLVAEQPKRDPDFRGIYAVLVNRFANCAVGVHRKPGDWGVRKHELFVETGLGGLWVGAHFKKTKAGWVAYAFDGGDIP